jgi:hypothetical protein
MLELKVNEKHNFSITKNDGSLEINNTAAEWDAIWQP